MSVQYLKVSRDVAGILQVGYMPVEGTEVYLTEPLDEPEPHQAHYTYATQDLALTDGWVPIVDVN
jgi:hypothetical protein